MPQRKKKCTDVYRKTFANLICKTTKLNWSFWQPQTPLNLQLQFDFQYWVSTESEKFNFRRSADFSFLFSSVMLVNYCNKEMMLASFFERRIRKISGSIKVREGWRKTTVPSEVHIIDAQLYAIPLPIDITTDVMFPDRLSQT